MERSDERLPHGRRTLHKVHPVRDATSMIATLALALAYAKGGSVVTVRVLDGVANAADSVLEPDAPQLVRADPPTTPLVQDMDWSQLSTLASIRAFAREGAMVDGPDQWRFESIAASSEALLRRGVTLYDRDRSKALQRRGVTLDDRDSAGTLEHLLGRSTNIPTNAADPVQQAWIGIHNAAGGISDSLWTYRFPELADYADAVQMNAPRDVVSLAKLFELAESTERMAMHYEPASGRESTNAGTPVMAEITALTGAIRRDAAAVAGLETRDPLPPLPRERNGEPVSFWEGKDREYVTFWTEARLSELLEAANRLSRSDRPELAALAERTGRSAERAVAHLVKAQKAGHVPTPTGDYMQYMSMAEPAGAPGKSVAVTLAASGTTVNLGSR